jgi:hypothetical protein
MYNTMIMLLVHNVNVMYIVTLCKDLLYYTMLHRCIRNAYVMYNTISYIMITLLIHNVNVMYIVTLCKVIMIYTMLRRYYVVYYVMVTKCITQWRND